MYPPRIVTIDPGEEIRVIAGGFPPTDGIPRIGKVILPMATAETKPWYEATRRFGPYNHHPGGCEDFNLESGGNTDLGEVLVAPFDGLVLANVDLRGAIGRVFQIMGIDEDDCAWIWTGWHMRVTSAAVAGDTVRIGDEIGEIGTANGRYAAHLHTQVCGVTSDSGIPAPWTFPSDRRYPWYQPSAWFQQMGVNPELIQAVTEFDGEPKESAPGPIAQCMGISSSS